uniref:Hypothetical membrane protein n=1 Tax=Thermoplasma acidophilum TaxID=2303 RepID=Q0KKY1_THEAI|nr:hypothetical membrane protein [Cloning vector pSTA]BAF30829.1 hypothetical membrane protein [Thermoplasma acidophilum]
MCISMICLCRPVLVSCTCCFPGVCVRILGISLAPCLRSYLGRPLQYPFSYLSYYYVLVVKNIGFVVCRFWRPALVADPALRFRLLPFFITLDNVRSAPLFVRGHIFFGCLI